MQPATDVLWPTPLAVKPTLTFAGTGNFGPGVQTFCLPRLWSLHVFHYHARLRVNDFEFELRPGRAALMPPAVTKTYTYTARNSAHLCMHFHFEAPAAVKTVKLPALVDLGSSFAEFDRALGEAIQVFPEDRLPAEVRLWDLLLRLKDAARGPRNSERIHPAIRAAAGEIELKLCQSIRISALADSVGLSHNHFTVLFRKHYGLTVASYIRQRRLTRARHLLRDSTLPIKAIAHEVGISDLQRFNKLVHREFGCSPRQLRTELLQQT